MYLTEDCFLLYHVASSAYVLLDSISPIFYVNSPESFNDARMFYQYEVGYGKVA